MLYHQFFLQTGEKIEKYIIVLLQWPDKGKRNVFQKICFPPSQGTAVALRNKWQLMPTANFFLNHIIQWKSFQDTCSWLASIVTYLNAAQANMTGPWWGWSPQLRKNLSRAWKMKIGIHSYSIIVLSFQGSNRLLNRNIPQVRLSPGVNDAVNSCQ